MSRATVKKHTVGASYLFSRWEDEESIKGEGISRLE